MGTATQVGDVVLEISEACDPSSIAIAILEMRLEPIYVALDLGRLKYSASDAARWVKDFTFNYRRLAREHDFSDLPPSAAVFVDGLSDEDAQLLRSVEAVIFDRSLTSNADCKSATQLQAKLMPALGEAREMAAQSPPKIPTRTMSPEELEALNSYPEGVTPDDIDRLMDDLNSLRPRSSSAAQTQAARRQRPSSRR